MKKALITIPVLLLLASPFINEKLLVPTLQYFEFQYLQSWMDEKEASINRIFSEFEAGNTSEIRSLANENDLSFFLLHDDELLDWNSNELKPPPYYKEFYRPTFYRTERGAYLIFVQEDSIGHQNLLVALCLEHEYAVSNKYLGHEVKPAELLSSHVRITSPSFSPYAVLLSSGQYAFGVDFTFKDINGVYYLLGILAWLAALISLHRFFRNRQAFHAGMAVAFVLLLASWWLHWPRCLFDSPIFDSKLFFGEVFHLSFGDIPVLSTLLFIALMGLRHRLKKSKNHSSRNATNWRLVGFHFSLLFSLWLTYETISNSTIPFSIPDILSFTWPSIICLLIVGFSLSFSASFLHSLARNGLERTKQYWIIGLAFFAPYIFAVIVLPVSFWVLLIPAILLACSLLAYLKSGKLVSRIPALVLLSLVYIFSSESFHNTKLELERSLVSSKLFKTNDAAAEFILSNLEQKLSSDAYVASYFKNPLVFRNAIEERISKLYVPPYLKRYDIEILFSTTSRRPGSNAERIALIKQEIKASGSIPATEHFYKIPTSSGLIRYGGIIPIGDDKTVGSLVFNLTEKTVFDESVYPELLVAETEINTLEEHYDFSVYLFGNLHKTTLESAPRLSSDAINQYPDKYLFAPDAETLLVIIEKKPSLFEVISAFGILLTLVILMYLFSRAASYISESLKAKRFVVLPLRERVIVTVFGTVLLAFILLSLLTVQNAIIRYEDSARNKLVDKLSKIDQFLEAEKAVGSNDVISSLTLLSSLFETDIDLFLDNGNLMYSTQQSLYDQGILTPLVNGNVRKMLQNQESNYVLMNRSVGSLDFLSAYSLVDVNGNPAVAHLAYFSKERELNEEIRSFSVRLFNLYLLSLVLLTLISAALIRYIIEPLKEIKKQLGETSLSGVNQRLEWRSNDELGELVDAYNSMTEELQASAKQLSESKQREAWREMAQQVAHEIKNPLTPMKLSIQQLQRAWADQHHNLSKIFERVTNVVISQIDSLSRIASEFSSFAKMPTSNPEVFDIKLVVDQVASLYATDVKVSVVAEGSPNTTVYADKEQMLRAINNIVKNGIQSVPESRPPSISIILVEVEDVLKISISDNGSGIPEDLREKIFKPSFSTKTSGMGLGLAITRNIIQAANGKLLFETEVDKGTTFHISLPTFVD